MSDSPVVIAAVIALVNAIVTGAMIAALNARLGLRLEQVKAGLATELEMRKAEAKHGHDLLAQADKAARDARLATYADFWAAISDLTFAQRAGDAAAERAATARLMAAKGRILLHGPAAVLAALAQFWRGGAALDSPAALRRFAVLVAEMRRDAGGAGDVVLEDALLLLFGIAAPVVDTCGPGPDGKV